MSQFQWQITSETVQESELGQFLIVLVLHTTPQRFQQPIPCVEKVCPEVHTDCLEPSENHSASQIFWGLA